MKNEKILERIKAGIQYRTLAMEAAGDDYVVRGYATTFDQPYLLGKGDGYELWELVERGAFDGADLSDVIMQYDHEGPVFARTRNHTLEVLIDEKGLAIKSDLGGTERGKKLFEEINGGYIDRMSFAFTVDEEALESRKESGIEIFTRRIKRIGKVYDVSAVSIPANDYTEISARSYGSFCAEKIKAEARKKKLIELKLKMWR